MGKVLKIREVGDPILNKMSDEVDIENINEVVIEDSEGYQSVGTSQGFPNPDKYINEIKETELGKVMDKIFSGKELGKGKGRISLLTKDEVSRIDLTKNAFIMHWQNILMEMYGNNEETT